MRNSLVSAALDMKPELLGAGVLACFFAAFLLAGLLPLAYQAAVVRWLFANLAFGDMRFEAKGYTTLGLVKLTAGNLLLLLVTLGLARPWMEMRILRFFWSNIRYSGDPKLRELLQDTLPERSGGECLLDALDMDLSI